MVNDSRQGHAAKQNIVSSTHLKDHNGTTAAHNIVHNRPNRPCHEAIKIRSPGTLSLSIDRCYNISLDSAFKQGFSSHVWKTQWGGLTVVAVAAEVQLLVVGSLDNQHRLHNHTC